MDFLDYLCNNGKPPRLSAFEIYNILDKLKKKGIFIYLDNPDDMKIVQDAGIRIDTRFICETVGEHKVIIHTDTISIGCKDFTKSFLKELLELQQKGVRINHEIEGKICVDDIEILHCAKNKGITVGDYGFKCDGFYVSIERIREWIS